MAFSQNFKAFIKLLNANNVEYLLASGYAVAIHESNLDETMKIKFFPDTDTAFLEFSDQEVSETKELSENIDDQGKLVSMTIEHARAHTGLPNLSMKEIKS